MGSDYLSFRSQSLYIQDRVVTIFDREGGEPVAKTMYHSSLTTAESAIKKLCQDNGLTGDYVAVLSSIFGAPQEVKPFTAEVVNPPVEVTFS